MKLDRNFYNRPTPSVAQDLLGCFLIRRVDGYKIIGRIVETEAYVGPNDLASHASRGRTKRNEVMFGPPGFVYVYLIYGTYYMFNIVTERLGYPAAVLIRAVEIDVSNNKSTNGPGKLSRYFRIDKNLNGVDLCGNKIWVEDDTRKGEIRKSHLPIKIKKSKRVGVDYAKEWKNKLWRFYIDGNDWVSRR